MNPLFRPLIALLLFAAPVSAQLPDPRDHHYQFGHKVLVEAMNDDDFVATLEKKASYLKSLWRDAAKQAKDGEKLSPKGLDHRTFDLGDDRTVVIVILPEAKVPAEAHMVGAEFDDGKLVGHVFTLEKGFDRIVLGGWDEGTHLNFGAGPENDPEKFRDAIIKGNKK